MRANNHFINKSYCGDGIQVECESRKFYTHIYLNYARIESISNNIKCQRSRFGLILHITTHSLEPDPSSSTRW